MGYSFQKTKEHKEIFELHYLFCFVFRKTQSHYVALVDLELKTVLPLTPKCWVC